MILFLFESTSEFTSTLLKALPTFIIDVISKTQIFIKTPLGDLIALEVENNEIIRDIKLKLRLKDGIQPEDQVLEFEEEDLEDEKTLQHYNISDNCTLKLIYTDYPIYIKLLSGEYIIIYVYPLDIIENLKVKVEEQKGIPPEQQHFYFFGHKLENEKTVHDYSITRESTIIMMLYISIENANGKKLDFYCCPNEKIDYIRRMVAEKEGIEYSNINLLFQGKIIDDGNTISDYGIEQNSCILWVMKKEQ